MSGLVTVFGGSGFVGTQVVRALAKRGWRVRVAVRRPHLAYKLRPLGDVGQIQLQATNILDTQSVARALEGADACINLVSILYETPRRTFRKLNVEGARNLAEAAKAAGVTRFVQVSAIGANPDGPSDYARTKAEGEAAVRRVFADAVIIRPSIVFGPDDRFLNRFAALSNFSPVLPLFGGGKGRFQPVYVGDVGHTIAEALVRPEAAGQTYELGGPEVFTFKELMQIVCHQTARPRLLLPIPWAVAGLIGVLGDIEAFVLGLAPPLTSDQLLMLRRDNVAGAGVPGLAALGVTPTSVEAIAPTYLWRYRKGGQFAEVLPAA